MVGQRGTITAQTNKLPHSGAHDVRSDTQQEVVETVMVPVDPIRLIDLESAAQEGAVMRSLIPHKPGAVELDQLVSVEDEEYHIPGICEDCGNQEYLNKNGYCRSCDPNQQ